MDVPRLLAFHPDLAAGMNAYRYARLSAAEQHAAATGYKGARYPWESALDGTEQIPPPVSKNSEGLFEQHITADIALAQWQYYVATGDRRWLAQRGWPVLSQAATFWASRASPRRRRQVPHPPRDRARRGEPQRQRRGIHERRRSRHAARCRECRARTRAAPAGSLDTDCARPGRPPPGCGPSRVRGYRGQLVKQADVTLLQYPWAYPMPRPVATMTSTTTSHAPIRVARR